LCSHWSRRTVNHRQRFQSSPTSRTKKVTNDRLATQEKWHGTFLFSLSSLVSDYFPFSVSHVLSLQL
jgi:hypothetical protein